jgi:hypothetical protein
VSIPSDAEAAAAGDNALVDDLLSFIARPPAGQAEVDAAFDRLALRLFEAQYRQNQPLRRYCQQAGRTPLRVRSWRDIPAVPIDAFKDVALSCAPPEQCERVFMTSGTTRADSRGRHYHPHLRVYDLSMRENFSRRFMQGQSAMRMGILFPTESALPNSSLAHYLQLALDDFGAPGSIGLLDEHGLHIEALCALLQQAERSGEPVALLGASYSFVHAIDALEATGARFRLPEGSRLLDTGGFKGRSRELDPQDFYRTLEAVFGVPADRCINMYGMTELSTQFYDDGNARIPSVKSGPHWIRSRVIDPLSGRDVPDGERGILAHCDLANFNSVTTILTEDSGVIVPGGFLLLGRAGAAEARGCSVAVEDFLRAAR